MRPAPCALRPVAAPGPHLQTKGLAPVMVSFSFSLSLRSSLRSSSARVYSDGMYSNSWKTVPRDGAWMDESKGSDQQQLVQDSNVAK